MQRRPHEIHHRAPRRYAGLGGDMTETMKLSDPAYRLFRKMDGELILQRFKIDKWLIMQEVEGHWENVETVNEETPEWVKK
jgi:hypothetical protein